MKIETHTLRTSLGASADFAQLWFEARTSSKSRAVFDSRGGIGDSGGGAVYVYYAADSTALYVGETGRAVKSRLHDQTSPHKEKPWWPLWTEMRFVQLEDQMDRLVLEFLLILGYAPVHNERPKAKMLSELLPS